VRKKPDGWLHGPNSMSIAHENISNQVPPFQYRLGCH
jgi:hypothetical protein